MPREREVISFSGELRSDELRQPLFGARLCGLAWPRNILRFRQNGVPTGQATLTKAL